MEPNFIRPAMTSYLSSRNKRPSSTEDDLPEIPAQPSRAAQVRDRLGGLLIALGERVAVSPRHPRPVTEASSKPAS